MPVHTFLSAYGTIAYCARAARQPLHEHYHELKFARIVAKNLAVGQTTLRSNLRIWPAVATRLREWATQLLSNEWVAPATKKDPTIRLFTDASRTGWGAVMYSGADVTIVAGRWGAVPPLHINVLEIHAITNAVKTLLVRRSEDNIWNYSSTI